MSRHLVLRRVGRPDRFEVTTGRSAVVGRHDGEGVEICIPDVRVARRHARVFEQEGRWHVEDLQSPSGVYVNGRCAQGATGIRVGDRIRIGVEFLVEMPEAEPVEQRTSTPTGGHCARCGRAIVEWQVRVDGSPSDRWHECVRCGCACPDCKSPMAFLDKDTSSGIEYLSYCCRTCGRLADVRRGVAMWKALGNDPANRQARRPGLIPSRRRRPVAGRATRRTPRTPGPPRWARAR